ncbi:hypothetical protein V5O48_013040 [Marasmius crinis-equi]|uniref:SH3 domain-containing protein n=1 Tax=Marasmius crinis-equi TaxID=585013 RepID=A0ABR3F1L1_9AGAR
MSRSEDTETDTPSAQEGEVRDVERGVDAHASTAGTSREGAAIETSTRKAGRALSRKRKRATNNPFVALEAEDGDEDEDPIDSGADVSGTFAAQGTKSLHVQSSWKTMLKSFADPHISAHSSGRRHRMDALLNRLERNALNTFSSSEGRSESESGSSKRMRRNTGPNSRPPTAWEAKTYSFQKIMLSQSKWTPEITVGTWVSIESGGYRGGAGLLVGLRNETLADSDVEDGEEDEGENPCPKPKASSPKAEVLLIPRIPQRDPTLGKDAVNRKRFVRDLFSLASAAAFSSKKPKLFCLESPACSDSNLCKHRKRVKLGSVQFEYGLLQKTILLSKLRIAFTMPFSLATTFYVSRHPSVLENAAKIPPPSNWTIESGDHINVVRWTRTKGFAESEHVQDPDREREFLSVEIDVNRDGGCAGTVDSVTESSCEVKLDSGFSYRVPMILVRKSISSGARVNLPEGGDGVVLEMRSLSVAAVSTMTPPFIKDYHVNMLKVIRGNPQPTSQLPSQSRLPQATQQKWYPAPSSLLRASLEPPFLRAIHDHIGLTEEELSFIVGDEIKIIEAPQGARHWWYGELTGIQGFVAAAHVFLVESRGPMTPVAPWKDLSVIIVGRHPRKGEIGLVQDVNVRRDVSKSGLMVRIALQTITASSGQNTFEIDYDNLRTLGSAQFLNDYRTWNSKQREFYSFNEGYVSKYDASERFLLPDLQPPLRLHELPAFLSSSLAKEVSASGGQTPLNCTEPDAMWNVNSDDSPRSRQPSETPEATIPFIPGERDWIEQDDSAMWIERPTLCVGLAGREVLADVKGQQDKWVLPKLDPDHRKVVVQHRADFDHRSNSGTRVDASAVQMSSKRPNLSRERGLMVIVAPPNLGSLVRRVWHTKDKLMIVRATLIDGSVDGTKEEMRVSTDDLAFVKETEDEKRRGNDSMERYRQDYRRT